MDELQEAVTTLVTHHSSLPRNG